MVKVGFCGQFGALLPYMSVWSPPPLGSCILFRPLTWSLHTKAVNHCYLHDSPHNFSLNFIFFTSRNGVKCKLLAPSFTSWDTYANSGCEENRDQQEQYPHDLLSSGTCSSLRPRNSMLFNCCGRSLVSNGVWSTWYHRMPFVKTYRYEKMWLLMYLHGWQVIKAQN